MDLRYPEWTIRTTHEAYKLQTKKRDPRTRSFFVAITCRYVCAQAFYSLSGGTQACAYEIR